MKYGLPQVINYLIFPTCLTDMGRTRIYEMNKKSFTNTYKGLNVIFMAMLLSSLSNRTTMNDQFKPSNSFLLHIKIKSEFPHRRSGVCCSPGPHCSLQAGHGISMAFSALQTCPTCSALSALCLPPLL